jgi:hypothetical protein
MLHFSLFEGLAASVDNAGGFVLMAGVVLEISGSYLFPVKL